MADRDRRHDRRDNRPNYSQRDNRPNYSHRNHNRNWNNGRRDYVRTHRAPVRYNNGHYRFHNGHSVRYSRPYIGVRYTNYRVRPVVLVENMAVVPGYIWVAGHWNWTGYEWSWISGHYAVDTTYAY